MGLTNKRPTGDIKDELIRLHVEAIQEEGFGNVIALTAVPTATVPLLEDNQWGEYNNILYQRIRDTIFVFTPGSTITVT